MNVMAKKSLACRRWLVGKAVLCLLQLAERGGHGLQEEVGLLEQVSKLYRSTVLTLMLAKAKFCVLFLFFLIGLISFVGDWSLTWFASQSPLLGCSHTSALGT